MSITPILSGISTGLSVLDSLTSAIRRPAPENQVAVAAVDRAQKRKTHQQARLEEAAQALGVQPQALEQALETARQQSRKVTGNLLDNAAQQLGVEGVALKKALHKAGVKLVDAMA